MKTKEPSPANAKCATGVPGLDRVIGGGLPCRRIYLIEGSPGSGKTTLALQFLLFLRGDCFGALLLGHAFLFDRDSFRGHGPGLSANAPEVVCEAPGA